MINFWNNVERRPAVIRSKHFAGRTYISEIKYIDEAKLDLLGELYSDWHKDVYGYRSSGDWTQESHVTLEDVMAHLIRMEKDASDENYRYAKEKAAWEAEKWVHRLMVDEARREGIVYPNPELDEDDRADASYLDYRKEHAECYYFKPKLAGYKMSDLGTLI